MSRGCLNAEIKREADFSVKDHAALWKQNVHIIPHIRLATMKAVHSSFPERSNVHLQSINLDLVVHFHGNLLTHLTLLNTRK